MINEKQKIYISDVINDKREKIFFNSFKLFFVSVILVIVFMLKILVVCFIPSILPAPLYVLSASEADST